MKTTLLMISLILACSILQAQVSIGTATYNKVERTAIVGQFDYSPDIVKSVLLEDMKYNGFLKSMESKGYKVYPGILFSQLSKENIDFYLKIDDVKKQKDKSVLHVLISKGVDNFITNSTDPDILTACISYIEGLMPKFEARQLEINITDQEDRIKKAEKSYNSLVGAGENLQDKKKDIEESIAKNKKEQEDQKALLEKERQLLDTLKSQRK